MDIVKRLLDEGVGQVEREARMTVWKTLRDAATEIETLRGALEYLLSEVENSSAEVDIDRAAIRDARNALHRDEDFEDRWDNA